MNTIRRFVHCKIPNFLYNLYIYSKNLFSSLFFLKKTFVSDLFGILTQSEVRRVRH